MQMLGPQGIKGLEATGPVECRGYGLTLTPWWCIENQLSDYCLPGFPCHECEAGVTIIPQQATSSKRAEIEVEVGRSDADPSGTEASKDPQSGAPALKRPKTRIDACATNRKPKTENRKRLLKTMSLAVARDLGLI